jgi:Leu/Phe-tRNA-protein transferase
MAGSPEAQRRQKWAERWVRRRLREERPDLHNRWWAEALEAWNKENQR